MLALTRKSDYGLVALTHLAQNMGRMCSAREIADVYQIPLPALMNILKTLTQHRMVTSGRGARGGYKLAMEMDDISLHMVITALEGDVHLFPCSQNGEREADPACEREGLCPISAFARKMSGRLQQFLEGVTLAEMVEDRVSVSGAMANESREQVNAIGILGQ